MKPATNKSASSAPTAQPSTPSIFRTLSNPGVALLLIVVAAVIFRMARIDYQSLWLDELYTVAKAHPANSLSAVLYSGQGEQPPAFFLYLHLVFKIFPYEAVTGRVACMILGLLALPIMYLLGREFGNRSSGIFAAFLTAINYFHIYYSQELRFYTMVFLLSALSYLFFVRGIKYSKAVWFVLYALTTSCLLLTHYYGLFVFGSQGIVFLFLLYYKGWNRNLFIKGAISAMAVAASFLPWVPNMMVDLGTDNFWILRPNPWFVAEYFYGYTGKDAVTTAVFLALGYLAVRAYRAVSFPRDGRRELGWILLFWIVICYLVPYLRSILHVPMLHPRYTIVILPAWLLLFSVGWLQLKTEKLKYAVIAVLVVSMTVNILFVRKHYTKITKEQFRESSEFVIRENRDGYPVYSELSHLFNFYFKDQKNQVLSSDGADYSGLDQFWLLQGFYDEAHMAGQLEKIPSTFEVVRQQSFFGAEATLLKRRTPNPASL